MKKKHISKNTNLPVNIFDRINMAITLIAISMVIAPYMYILTFFNFSYPALVSLCLVLAAVFAGYSLQWIFGTVTRIRRIADYNAYDNIENFFKPHQALLTFIIAFITGIMIKNAVTNYLKYRFEIGLENSFDKYTLIPAAIAVLSAAAIIIGIVIWFYPFGRIISLKTVIPYVAVFFINFMLTLVYGGVSQSFSTLCLFIYIICAFILLNQNNIQRTFKVTKTVKITAAARLYNLSLILIVILGLTAVLIVTISFTVGISAIIKIVMFFILSSVFREEEVLEEASVIAKSFNDSVFSGLIDSLDVNGNISKLFFLLFFVIIIGIMVFFIISRRREVWLSIKNFFSVLLNNIIDFILNVINLNRSDRETYTILDYRDEEMKMDESSVKEYNPQKNLKKNSFRDFMARLNTIQNENDKLQFAYSVLTESWKKENFGISSSDTPREIKVKILYKSEESEIGDITEVFEIIKYAEMKVDNNRSKNALDTMCRLLQRYFD